MDKAELRNKLKENFNLETWKNILGKIFHKIDYLSVPNSIEDKSVKNGGQIGTIRLDDNRSLALFAIEVADNIDIARNRKGLRNIAIRYIDQDIIHGILVFYYSKKQTDYRLTFVSKATALNEAGEFQTKETAPKRYTFLLGGNEPCTTAAIRLYELVKKENVLLSDVTDAFSVERLNKDFFKGYKDRYKKFCDFLTGNAKDNRDYVKKLLGRLVFLQFLQKKGWMGVPASSKAWEGGDKAYMQKLVEHYKDNDRLLSDVLELLFFNTLNEARPDDIANSRLGDNIKIPYLNGGLFDKDALDNRNIDFPYSYFYELMEFFSEYNFTIDENDPDDAEVGIDPEMLGHIFENLLEDNKDKGAFYTPKEIVQYMCRETIVKYLKSHIDEQLYPAVETLIKQGVVDVKLQNKTNANEVYNLLKTVKVCDPAIGSGAFPMGVLNVLYHARMQLYGFLKSPEDFSHAKVKRDIIQNNIFGVDIEQGAVDIARLRFWLALVVDETIPQPLPNLDYKIMCGNSLTYRYPMDIQIDDVLVEYNQNVSENQQLSLELYKSMVYKYTNTSDHTRKAEFKAIIEKVKQTFKYKLTDRELLKIKRLKKQLADYDSPMLFELSKAEKQKVKVLKKQLNTILKKQTDIENSKIYENAFEWRFEFPALLDDIGTFTGFDVIIGNPPYGAKLTTFEKQMFKDKYADVHMRTPETFCYFTSLAFNLCKQERAVVSYIVPNNILFQNENEKTRRLLAEEHTLVRAINLGDNTFENADVPTCIFVANTEKTVNYNIAYSDYRQFNVKNIKWDEKIEDISIEKQKSVPAMVIGMSNSDINILDSIRSHGVTIDAIAEEMASGISTGGDKIFRITKDVAIEREFEITALRKILVGSEIEKYNLVDTNNLIIYSTKQADIPQYPNIYKYLQPFEEQLSKKRETQKGVLPWWCLHWPRYVNLFTEPKIIMRQTSDCIRCVYDEEGYFVLNSILVFKKNTEFFTYKYIATVLNSCVTDYMYKKLTQEEGRTFAEVKPANVRKLYIPKAENKEQELLETLYDYMAFLKNVDSAQVDKAIGNEFVGEFFQQIIDGCVYELFFGEHMQERDINIIEYLFEYIKPFNDLSEESIITTISKAFDTLYKSDNPVRTRLSLFVSRSPEILKIIIQH
ncbi:Eco57I restriction-modification methylase domain-containing protein [Segatella oris]|uniref:Eco57I restriction-modification methylase domain-containing protein n=1 Tax=Segatella oris TaxID=28135 RepID=UPI0028E5A75C|nr:TaqI-like C-terminal specificity domain-containing protein [Segatella oris]